MTSPIYLDNNATTQPLPEVVDVMLKHFTATYANPGSSHSLGRKARQVLEDARESIAAILGARPSEVVFTSGGTEATNMAIFGLTPTSPGVIALTAGEHPATMEACKSLKKRCWKLHTLQVDSEGLLCTEQFDLLPWNELKLVAVILAHNETGVIQDLHPLADLCHKLRVPLHVDAVQAVGKIPVNFSKLNAATLALGAHKFHGPRGIGALLIQDGVQLAPYQFGGHQESGRRPGTEMVALAAGMARALELWQQDSQHRMRQLALLRDRLESGLRDHCSPVVVNGSREHRLPNTLHIAFPGLDAQALLVALDLKGVACSLGSTCASGSHEPPPVLLAMNRPPEVYTSSVRFSVGVLNSIDEIDEAIRRITKVVCQLRLNRD